MFTRSTIKHTVLTVLSIGALALVATEAAAQTCVSSSGVTGRYIFGKCYYPASVRAEVDLTNIRDAKQNPKLLQFTAHPQGAGLLFCGNRKGNQPPGVVQLIVQEPLTGETFVTTSNNNGAVQVSVTANLSEDVLAQLDQFCPNTQNFDVLSFVPCQFNGTLSLSDINTGRALEAATDSCTLPDCTTLSWNNKTGRPEERAYECQAQ